MAHMLTLALQQQESVLRGAIQGLLGQIAQDYNLDHQELMKKYLTAPEQSQVKNGDGIPAPLLVAVQQEKQKKRTTKPKPDKVCCKGVTAKGQPCKFAALADGFCKKHSDINNKPEGSNTAKKAPKTQQRPRHTHLVEEEPETTCQVCEQQGDVTKPEMPRQKWEIEGAEEIQARLKKMLAEADDPEETEETEETTEEATASPEEFGIATEELKSEQEEEEEDDMSARLKQILAEDTDEEDDEWIQKSKKVKK